MEIASQKSIKKTILKAAVNITGKLLPLFYYIIIIATISGIAATFFSVSYLKNKGPLQEEKTILIPSGSSTFYIAKQLSKNNIIEFPQLFTIIIKITKSGKSLKAGEYSFSPAISPMNVLHKIKTGDVKVRKITIPEGLYTSQILELINKAPAQEGELPENIAEGELLPETYEYHYGEKRANMILRMKKAMTRTIDELWETRQADLPINNKQEALALASLIEKETAVPQERKRVAAVFINRLKKGMRLQTDPSVIYAVTKGKYILERPLSHKDLNMESPYNTYRNRGLPPTPIANPGRASIEAALNPLDTNEIYFVASGNGGHAFSENLEQHNENVAKLRKREKEARNNLSN